MGTFRDFGKQQPSAMIWDDLSEAEKQTIKAFRRVKEILTERSFNEYWALFERYFMKLDNDKAFRDRCDILSNVGINPLAAWLEKNGFKGEYKDSGKEPL